MFWSWVKACLLLPVNAVVFIPGIILYFSGYSFAPAHGWRLFSGMALFAAGLGLAIWTMTLFQRRGHGTPAPWDPPKKLVVAGPYRYVRNPMLSSVFIMLFASWLLLDAWQSLAWFIIFVICNMIYFPLFEEPALEKRFGKEYLLYKANVPRYIPRLTPWNKQ